MKKKISIVTSGHPYFDERIFYKFARSLNKNGYDVSIICSTVESELDIVKDNIHIIGFNGSNLKKSKKVSKFEEHLKRTMPDVIICCEPLTIFAANKIRNERKKVQIIYDITEWYPHQNMLKNLSRLRWITNYVYLFSFNIYAASLCNHLIIGEKSKATLYKIFLPFHSKTILGYYPPHEYFKHSLPTNANKNFTICYVGIINEKRGIFPFLEVLKRLTALYPEINFTGKVIGTFEDELIKQNVFSFIESNKELKIEFVGWIIYEKLSEQLKDVAICLDLREKDFIYNHSFPIKIFEFMACGKPVIYSNIKSLSKFKDITKFGFLVAPTDIESTCNKISIYIKNPSLLKEHSQAARELFDKKYNWLNIESLLLKAVEVN